jgi:hypothetical protein
MTTGSQVVFKIILRINPIPNKSTKNKGIETINWGNDSCETAISITFSTLTSSFSVSFAPHYSENKGTCHEKKMKGL